VTVPDAGSDKIRIPGAGDATVLQVQRGRLGSTIRRLRLNGREWYLKEGEGEAAGDLVAEQRRLEWLQGRLPVPEVHRLPDGDDHTVRLLLSAVPGDPSQESPESPGRVIKVLAGALRDIHALPVQDCPFRDTLRSELAEAERRVRLRKLDVDAFLASSGGLAPAKVLKWLHAKRGIIRETVFTHGDYCLPNVIVREGRLSGVIDWGIAGIADKHRDFMAVRESIEHNLGDVWVDRFFEAYGEPRPDEERVRYYTLLDRFYAHYRP
jgi:aminoglycoside phosphotransferase